MKILKIKERDIGEIAGVYGEVYSEKPYNEKWDKNTLLKKIKDMLWMKGYIAVVNRKIVGFIFFYGYNWCEGKKGYIEELGVLKEFRNKDIAKKLMIKAEQELKRDGVKEIQLNVRTDSKAIKIYYKWGYRKTNIIKLKKRLK